MDAFVATLDWFNTLNFREWFITGGVVALVMFLLMIDYRT
ncbi:hypothetical protein PSNTI_20360 [Stutzerimonas stutzeri]|jgi:hypothetical protein|nr:hypothetical protein PSNTI_20360 [Stutzerimonas stutzeri]CAB5537161.1 Uncharacterised protein [Stutzerimonas stutzeri]CAB5585990.1 Uncharacterised protein [Stutzerimonas stutzeri]CAC9103104.1 Uncharacterised protein [Stutzerimonas stutzeri]